jgi:glycine cleavage system regulatory protein
MTHLLLTLLGPDRPGLVDALAHAVREHEGNWLESRLAKLAGHFAGVVRIAVPIEQSPALQQSLAQLAEQGLTVQVYPADALPTSDAPTRMLQLHLVGHDRPGIVREVSHALATRGLNITELTTAVTSAPMTGDPLFTATATLAAPADASLDELHATLDQLADQLDLDLDLDEV